jgi:hypothetical protein
MEEIKEQLPPNQNLGGFNQSDGKDPKAVPDPGGGMSVGAASTRTNTGPVD